MTHLLLFGSLLVASIPAFSQANKPSIKALDEKNGFRDLRFGIDTAEVKGRLPLRTEDGIDYFTRPADSPKIGGSQVAIYYGFYKGKLLTVGLTAPDKANGQALLSALVSSYGLPAQANKHIESYVWNGAAVVMTADFSKTLKPQVFIVSRAILAQRLADQQAAAKKGASDL